MGVVPVGVVLEKSGRGPGGSGPGGGGPGGGGPGGGGPGGGQNFALFISSPDPLFVFFFQFLLFFVELWWVVRVCNIEKVFTTHIWALWTSCETPAVGGPNRKDKTLSRDVTTTPHLACVSPSWAHEPPSVTADQAGTSVPIVRVAVRIYGNC